MELEHKRLVRMGNCESCLDILELKFLQTHPYTKIPEISPDLQRRTIIHHEIIDNSKKILNDQNFELIRQKCSAASKRIKNSLI